MPLTLQTRQLADAHRQLQGKIGVRTTALVIASFHLLDPEDLDGSADRWLSTTAAVVQGQRAQSAATAAAYLRTLRIAELDEEFDPVLAEPADPARLATSLAVTGPIGIKANLSRGVPLAKAMDLSVSAVAGAAVRHTLDGGRETVTATAKADPRARGWERVTSGSACDFCESLTDQLFTEAGSSFESHDRCMCNASPSYG
jgi:hypothetical protein